MEPIPAKIRIQATPTPLVVVPVPEPDPAKTGFVTPLLRISFPGRPIFILFIPVDEDVAGVLVGLIGLVVEVHGGHAALLEVAQADEAVLRRGGESVKIHKINRF